MALLGFLRSWDEREGEPVLKDVPTILAYIEDLIRIRSSIQFWLKDDDLVPFTGRIDLLSELPGTMTVALQRALPCDLAEKTGFKMVFPLEGMRFEAPVRFLRRDGYLRAIFAVPERVCHAERRTKMRARFGPRERATCTVLEGLFEGHGVTGRLVNLSLEGACMRIDKAISIQRNHAVSITPELFEPGRSLAIIRVQNLPQTPMIECFGKVTHIESTPIGVLMGLCFEGLGTLETQCLAQVMARRLPSFARGFPVRYRRGRETLESEPESDANETDWNLNENIDAANDSAEDASASESFQDARVDTHERLLQLRKRGKRVLIILKDDLDRAILSGTLQVDGYRQIAEAGSVVETLRAVRTLKPDLIVMEPHLGEVNAQQLVERLRLKAGCEKVPVVMIADDLDIRTKLMAKAARIDHLQAWPTDYDETMKGVLTRLLAIE